MTDDELKKLLQEAGFHNGRGPYEVAGGLRNFRELIRLLEERAAK